MLLNGRRPCSCCRVPPPLLVVPELERPRARESPPGQRRTPTASSAGPTARIRTSWSRPRSRTPARLAVGRPALVGPPVRAPARRPGPRVRAGVADRSAAPGGQGRRRARGARAARAAPPTRRSRPITGKRVPRGPRRGGRRRPGATSWWRMGTRRGLHDRGAGPNGASPHHEPGERTILAGDVVVMDFGGGLGGYCSDIPGPSRWASRRRSSPGPPIVQEAQQAALQAVGPGLPRKPSTVRPAGSSTEADSASASSIEPVTGSASRCTRRPTWSRGIDPPWWRACVLDRAGHLPGPDVRRADRGHRGGDGRRCGAAEPFDARACDRRLTTPSN